MMERRTLLQAALLAPWLLPAVARGVGGRKLCGILHRHHPSPSPTLAVNPPGGQSSASQSGTLSSLKSSS